MYSILRLFSCNRLVCLAVTGIFQLIFSINLQGQGGANLLVNGSFESPAVALTNGNNIMGAGNDWSGWSCTNGGLNILRVQGSGYASGANKAADGDQYVDVANSDGYIHQPFTLVNESPVYFSGSFSNREAGWSDYVNWTARIDILDSTGTIVATSSTRDFITTDNNETWYTLTGSTSPLAAGTYTYRAYAGNSGHFDDAIATALAGTILPVKLKSFTASIEGSRVIANWSVSEEDNVKGYELQVSTDGIHFKGLDFVTGNHSGHYTAVDENPVNGLSYYRLKTHDLDGKVYYSDIHKADFHTDAGATVYPNPATGVFHLALKNDMVKKSGSLMIITPSGRTVLQRSIGVLSQTETIDISQLATGMYFVWLAVDGQVINKTLRVTGK